MCVCAGKSQRSTSGVCLYTLHLNFWDRVYHWPWSSPIGKADWPVRLSAYLWGNAHEALDRDAGIQLKSHAYVAGNLELSYLFNLQYKIFILLRFVTWTCLINKTLWMNLENIILNDDSHSFLVKNYQRFFWSFEISKIYKSWKSLVATQSWMSWRETGSKY